MKKSLLGVLLFICAAGYAAVPLVFRGDTLLENTEYERIQCGDLASKKTMAEISGIACSRVTPGYIWMESDNISSQIIATTEKGNACYLKVRLTLSSARWDWEDLCGGVYDDKNYIFIGAIGDNEENGGEYRIHYFEEPAIPDTIGGTIKISAKSIHFQYPNGVKNNAEALMYDNKEQMLYVITKKYYQPCQVFRMPFRLDYGTSLQTMEYVCDLGISTDIGIGSTPWGEKAYKGFHLVTGADISPDGSLVLIKNQNNTAQDNNEEFSWVLLWKREGDESISETLKRQPEVIHSYEQEWQGEAICWLNNNVFYTMSDDSGNPPIYKYVKPYGESIEVVNRGRKSEWEKVLINNTLYLQGNNHLYSLDGRIVK